MKGTLLPRTGSATACCISGFPWEVETNRMLAQGRWQGSMS